MNYESEETPETGVVVRMDGQPNEPDRPGEGGLFNQFKNWISGLSGIKVHGGIDGFGFELSRTPTSGPEADRALAEAALFGAQAAEIQARMDDPLARVAIVNEEIRKISADVSSSPEAKALQFENLLAAAPEVASQAEVVSRKILALAAIHSTRITKNTTDTQSSPVPLLLEKFAVADYVTGDYSTTVTYQGVKTQAELTGPLVDSAQPPPPTFYPVGASAAAESGGPVYTPVGMRAGPAQLPEIPPQPPGTPAGLTVTTVVSPADADVSDSST